VNAFAEEESAARLRGQRRLGQPTAATRPATKASFAFLDRAMMK
jgi:hypothetical protein